MKVGGSGAAAIGLSTVCNASEQQQTRERIALSETASGGGPERQERLSRSQIESEIQRRAQKYLARDYLEVDYYRIRRQLAYPLPVKSLSIPTVPVPTIKVYPWATWMTWELEERVCCLGWVAEWFSDREARTAAARDLAALAEWPEYRQYPKPDLSSGHAGRILWRAYTHWHWLDEALRDKIEAGCQRHVESVLPESDRIHGQFSAKEDILELQEPHRQIHNIPFIGTVGAALTASVVNHPGTLRLRQRLQALFGTILDLRGNGIVEGVAYDGYVLDFVADWMSIVPVEERAVLLDHPNLRGYLEESYRLAAPGTSEQVAELSDVEPKEMPFHLSAQAKLYEHQPDPIRAWHLSRCRADWLRADALAALHGIADGLGGKAPEAGVSSAHYATVLRSGWESGDLAVAMSCTNSPMGHIQCDNGSLTLGTRGRWLITDPGYQQYMKDQEREFTLGPGAHNTPVINGLAQDRKEPIVLSADATPDGMHRFDVELGSCYPEEAGVESVVRSVWLAGQDLVVVADRVRAKATQTVAYHWHGHPSAAWWAQANWAMIHFPDVRLWITSPQCELSGADIQRLPGSRGQLTLAAEADAAAPVIWWTFALGDESPSVELDSEGLHVRMAGRSVDLRVS